jgi:PAT family beta-lactamase induction signal transducer AmpG
VYVDAHGYEAFFTSTALLGAPVLLLVWLASRILPVTQGDNPADY